MALLTPCTAGATPDVFRRQPRQARHDGFTLVELAVVVAVIALLLGSLLVPLTTQVEQRNVAHTDVQLEEIREALLGFAMVNGRLPRPANSITDGSERALCATAQDCTGYLPWVALGVRKTDAWGKMFRYSVSPDFANAIFNLSTTLANAKTVQTRDSGGALVSLATNLPAVVLSYGANNFGTSDDGTAIANSSATNIDEQNNDSQFNTCTTSPVTPPCSTFIGRQVATNTSAAGGDFDDRLVWVSANLLFNRMVTAGKLP
ncbi:MAG TPA: prepilin-type N-terminal cleavage/methylation domain-containing protein [Burkholderiales bacterium]|nr:prepilin-type N-terminal cleavage/methylation domain-containing protein [Burkholderiales bacterium]